MLNVQFVVVFCATLNSVQWC